MIKYIFISLLFASQAFCQSTVTGTISGSTVMLSATDMHSSFADAATVYCQIASGSDWEIALCTYNYPANTLTVGAIQKNSNGNTVAITFVTYHNSAGSVTPVIVTYQATTYPSLIGSSSYVTGVNTGDQTTVSGNAGTATALQTARTINGTSFDGSANITVTAAANTLTGSTLASGVTSSSLTVFGSSIALGTPASGALTNCTSIPVAQATGVLPVANGGSMTGTAAMSATTGTITVPMTSAFHTVTPTGNMTWNATAGTVIGQFVSITITTSGTTSFTMTPSTNFKSATLATGTVTAKQWKLLYRWDGTFWQEECRTAAQ